MANRKAMGMCSMDRRRFNKLLVGCFAGLLCSPLSFQQPGNVLIYQGSYKRFSDGLLFSRYSISGVTILPENVIITRAVGIQGLSIYSEDSWKRIIRNLNGLMPSPTRDAFVRYIIASASQITIDGNQVDIPDSLCQAAFISGHNLSINYERGKGVICRNSIVTSS